MTTGDANPSSVKQKRRGRRELAAGGLVLVAAVVSPRPALSSPSGNAAFEPRPIEERVALARESLKDAAPRGDTAQLLRLTWWGNWHNWGYHPWWHNWPNWRNWHNWGNGPGMFSGCG